MLTCQRTGNSRSIIPDISIRETKNGQAQTTESSLVRIPSTQKCQLKALWVRRQSKFRKKSKNFTDRRTALSDKGTDTTDSDAPIQALIQKIFKKSQYLSAPQHPRHTYPAAPSP